MRSTRSMLGALASFAVMALVASCGVDGGQGPDSPDTASRGIDVNSDVDAATGSIVFPYDRLYASERELADVARAGALALSLCAKASGVDFRVSSIDMYSTLYDASNYFGVWVSRLAERFAFVPPMTDRDLAANGVVSEGAVFTSGVLGTPEQPDTRANVAVADHNGMLSDADRAVVEKCRDGPDGPRRFDLTRVAPPGPWSQPLERVVRGFDSDAVARTVYGELDVCLTAHGLEPDPAAPGLVVGAAADLAKGPMVISEEQIELALQVVACKTEVDLVPRLAKRMAELQAPILVEHAAELIKQRQRIDAVVAEARALLAEQTR